VAGVPGSLFFTIMGNAGNATIVNQGGGVSGADGGLVYFTEQVTAATASITNEAGMVAGASGGLALFVFSGATTAGDATITCQGVPLPAPAAG
jgi:hypothetical protein